VSVRHVAFLIKALLVCVLERIFSFFPSLSVTPGELIQHSNFLRAVPLNQVQFDELSAGLRAGRTGDRRGAEAIERRARSPPWGWTAMAPESQRRLSVQGGHAPERRPQPGCIRFHSGWRRAGCRSCCAMATRIPAPPWWRIAVPGGRRRGASPEAQCRNPAGGPGPGCSRRRGARPCDGAVWSVSGSGWSAGRWRRSSRDERSAAGR
jgi:hypothetical protein